MNFMLLKIRNLLKLSNRFLTKFKFIKIKLKTKIIITFYKVLFYNKDYKFVSLN